MSPLSLSVCSHFSLQDRVLYCPLSCRWSTEFCPKSCLYRLIPGSLVLSLGFTTINLLITLNCRSLVHIALLNWKHMYQLSAICSYMCNRYNRYFKLKTNKIQLISYKLALLPVFLTQEIALPSTQLLKRDISPLASLSTPHSSQLVNYQALLITFS